MKTKPIVQHTLQRVGENLYRSDSSGRYYALFKRDGKQIRRSLKTTDKELARRKLAVVREKVGRLTSDQAKFLPFAEYNKEGALVGGIAKRWLEVAGATLKPSSYVRREVAIKALYPFFRGLTVNGIGLKQVESWFAKRSHQRNAQTVNIETETLRGILGYACRHGLILDNPVAGIKRLRLTSKPIMCPTRDQFRAILEKMRSNVGKRDAQQSADMIEFLGYAGWRKGEAANLQWQHINFELGQITIVGDEITGPKEPEGQDRADESTAGPIAATAA